MPYPKQIVPLAAIKATLGKDADLIAVSDRLVRWYWCGVLGELYGSAIETRFARDIEMVPTWAMDDTKPLPRTVQDANFTESRLHSLRTRNAAAYKGIAALILDGGARDWMEDKALDKVQHAELAVDIHHVFPQKWCNDTGIDDEHPESIVNKTTISAGWAGRDETFATDAVIVLMERHSCESACLLTWQAASKINSGLSTLVPSNGVKGGPTVAA